MTALAPPTDTPRYPHLRQPAPAARALILILGLALALPVLVPRTALGQGAFPFPTPMLLQQGPGDVLARQVTLFGVLATPNDAQMDPKLAAVASQLRKLLPNHGFRLLGVQSRRLTVGQSLPCALGDGFTAEATLLHPFDLNGKVQLRCEVKLGQIPQLETLVGTPPNQLFFCEKPLPNGQRLLIGVGAR